MIKLKLFLIGVLPLIVGLISSLFVDFNLYNTIILPNLSPPAFLFPIVWTILYLMIGISFVLIIKTNNSKENRFLFIVQLLLNFIWVITFFRAKLFLLSFVIIIVLDIVTLYTILSYYRVNKVSAYLLMPYFLWICFASYLNWNIFLLN